MTNDEILGLLAETAASTPPSPLAARIAQTATATRPAGQVVASLGGGTAADPAAAFLQTIDEFKAVLATADGWAVVEPYGWSVTQLVAHLVEVDLYFGRQLGLWDHEIDGALEDDHLALTETAVRASVRSDFGATVSKWLEVSAAVCAHVASLDADQLGRRIKFHMLETRISTALVVRVFEVWTHLEDLCRALRCDPPPLDAPRLHLMTRTAVRAIPLGMLLDEIDNDGQTARIVLTGRGGGVWNQPLKLGAEVGETAVTIVADALQFCRLAAQRITPVELDADVEGPVDLALRVLHGASVFAA